MLCKVQTISYHAIKTLYTDNANNKRQEGLIHHHAHSSDIMMIFSSICFLWEDRDTLLLLQKSCTFSWKVTSCLEPRTCSSEQHINYLHCSNQKKDQIKMTTYSPNFAQIANATLRIISEPSKNTESQIFRTVWLGRQVAKRVRNHCIVKTFVSGGS